MCISLSLSCHPPHKLVAGTERLGLDGAVGRKRGGAMGTRKFWVDGWVQIWPVLTGLGGREGGRDMGPGVER